eukprot:1156747-Pelagomonas_calceolata.AAC.1
MQGGAGPFDLLPRSVSQTPDRASTGPATADDPENDYTAAAVFGDTLATLLFRELSLNAVLWLAYSLISNSLLLLLLMMMVVVVMMRVEHSPEVSDCQKGHAPFWAFIWATLVPKRHGCLPCCGRGTCFVPSAKADTHLASRGEKESFGTYRLG